MIDQLTTFQAADASFIMSLFSCVYIIIIIIIIIILDGNKRGAHLRTVQRLFDIYKQVGRKKYTYIYCARSRVAEYITCMYQPSQSYYY